MTQWTPQQQAAIEDRGRSVIVSAAAGSGKTAVLVERLLRILSDTEHRTPAESMIVVTFTNDAAAQMKQRLQRALTQKLTELDGTPDAEDAALWLMHQQSALGSAKISTINAFCFDLIRENAEQCSISPQFGIVEPAGESVYVRKAMQIVMDRWNKQHPDEMEMLYNCLCTRNDAELEDIVLRLAGFLKSIAFPGKWIQDACQEAADPVMLLTRMRERSIQEIGEVLTLVHAARPYAEQAAGSLKENKFLALLEEDLMNIQDHLKAISTVGDPELIANPLHRMAQFTDFPRQKKNTDEEARQVFQLFRNLYKDKYKDVVAGCLAPLRFYHQDLASQASIIPPLLALTQDYSTALFEEKKKHNVLSFDDGERLALSLLGELQEDGTVKRTPLGDRLSEEFNIIMVDEYQDSNNKQDCLFKLLSRGSGISEKTGRLCYGSNAFLVGDIKQSIYSFRLANPQNFMNALEESVLYTECPEGGFARIYLNQNFRSSVGVIDFVNVLFRVLMTETCGEVNYDENEYLNFGAKHYTDCPDTKTTLLFPHTQEEEENIPEDPQGACIASVITDMLARKVPVTLRDGSSRPCQPGDFCILLRSVKNDGAGVQAALEALHIPVMGDDESAFLQLPEIELIRSLLQIIDNPLTDMAMAAVLLSPICGMTPDDLCILKAETHSRRIYLQLQKLMRMEDLPEDCTALREKTSAFLSMYESLRAEADTCALEDLILLIYDRTDLLSLQALYHDADKRRSHLMDFHGYARSYREHADLNHTDGLTGWLRYLDHVEESGKDLDAGPLPPVQLDAVAIKTIHKSKGLEYPFVFLCHTEREFFKKQGQAPVLPDDSGLLGLKLYDRDSCQKSSTAAHRIVLADLQRKQRSEELRLLYVALTRAQQQLFLVMDPEHCRKYCLGNKPKEGEYKMKHLLESAPSAVSLLAPDADCMGDWLVQYLLATNQGDLLLAAIDDQQNGKSRYADFIVHETKTKDAALQTERIALVAEPDTDALSIMDSQLGFVYTSDQIGLPAKHSVTGLAHPDSIASDRMHDPHFLTEAADGKPKKLRGAARGTAVHKIMQYLDFEKAADSPQTALQMLVEEGRLTPTEATAIDNEALAAFFASPLCKRIARADIIHKEKQFFVKIGALGFPEDSDLYKAYAGTDGILIGTMDLLFHDDDGWALVDYKSDYAKDPEPLLREYSLQLGLYCKAAECIFGEPVRKAYLYAFSLQQALEIDPDRIHYTMMEATNENERKN
ncbi:MAG: UvrD-helicase domain-containing protein [Oscillospiraceae bacterium]|nr:UvrD-helicase domain-containing protein [Oscillospiraceae bacterium]